MRQYLANAVLSGSALICSLMATPSFAKVLYITEHGFAVENKIHVENKQDAWQALVGEVDNWWPKDHTWWGKEGQLSIDPVAGGCFCEDAESRSAEHMRISYVDPNKTLRMTGGLGPLQGLGMYGALEWQFADSDKGATVTLTYRVNGYTEGGFEQLAPVVDKVQGIQLSSLKTHLSNN